MTKDEYLQRVQQDPWQLSVKGVFPADDWLAAAWELEDVREAHSYSMARTVSKGGDLFFTNAYLTALGRSLSVPRQVELFHRIRGRSPHREVEFRGQFEQFFPRSKPFLPPPLTREEIVAALGLDEASAQHLIDGEPWTGGPEVKEVTPEPYDGEIPF
jgi:hypothetical protein